MIRAAAQALGYPDVVAPPTFAIVHHGGRDRGADRRPGLGLDFSRVVHGDQRFVYTRPVHAGDGLSVPSPIAEITERGGHDFLTTRTEITTADGEPVVTACPSSSCAERAER